MGTHELRTYLSSASLEEKKAFQNQYNTDPELQKKATDAGINTPDAFWEIITPPATAAGLAARRKILGSITLSIRSGDTTYGDAGITRLCRRMARTSQRSSPRTSYILAT
jgi:hypothetical protein